MAPILKDDLIHAVKVQLDQARDMLLWAQAHKQVMTTEEQQKHIDNWTKEVQRWENALKTVQDL